MKRYIRLRIVAVFAVCMLFLAACGAPALQSSAPTAAPVVQASVAPTIAPQSTPLSISAAETTVALTTAAAPVTITDDLSRNVTLNTTPQRIISLAPSVTEILFAVGAGSQVVGDTKYCNYPPEADALPEIGGFSAKSISVESIVGLQPDLVIAGTTNQKSVVDALEQLSVPVVVLAPDSFDAVYRSITQVGTITGHTQEAEKVVAAMQKRVEAVTTTIASVPVTDRPSVFWEVYNDPLTTSGPNTFIGQMIELVGATNVFADATEDYPQVNAEAIIERNPAVILGPSSQSGVFSAEAIAQRPGWTDIQAVRDGRVYTLDGDSTSRPGPRLADGLEALAKALYPAVFP